MDYRMDFLSSREKDPLYAKYSTYPGWHSSHTYEHSPSTATYLQYLSDYGEPNTRVALGARNNLDNKQTEASSTTRVPSQSKLSHRELYDYIDGVRNLVPVEKQRSDSRSYKERDIYAHWEGWESTWQANRRGKAEHVGTNSHQELQAYVNRHHHTLPKKTPGFEVEDWRSSRCSSNIEKLLGCGQWDVAKTSERLQPTSVSSHKRDHGEHWGKWSPWDSRNMESLFPLESFRQPPSYTAPPAYSSPKDGYKLAGIPKVSAQTFPEQTFENRNINFTETRRNASANNGRCSQNNNQTQTTESYITGGQKQTYSVMQYTAIKTKPSPHTKLQYPESTQMTYPDSTQIKQTKPLRRKGGETVFCLVSRMGEVSGLSSSPEEPLKSHVLPLFKPNDKTIETKQTNSPQCRQNQDEYLKRDEAERQLNGCFMFRGHGNTVLEHTGGDQQSNSIRDLSNVVNPDKNKQDLQWNDSQSDCLAQKSSMQTDRHEKPGREIIEKFPLWKEPKYSTGMKEERNGQPQEIINESKVTNIEDNNNSTNDQQQSLVIIDATCVVVKVELVHLPEKEHVQYVCLTEEGPSSSTSENDEQKQESSVLSTQESPKDNTVDKRAEGILGRADEHHRIVKNVPEEPDRSWDGHVVGPTKGFDESPIEAGEVLEYKLMLGQPGSGTTSENNDSLEEIIKAEDQTTAKHEAVLEDLVLTNAEPISEYFEETTETTIIQIKEIKEQENRPILDDSDCVNPETEQDTPKDLTKSKTEDETDGQREPVLDNSTPLIRKSTENSNKIKDAHNFVLPSTLGNGTLRRSSSSPHLSINSSVLDTSHSDDELWLLSSSTNTEDSQCSGSPSVQSSSTNSLPSLPSTPIPDVLHNSSLPQTRSEPDDAFLCTSLPSEHNLKIQHAKSLRDAVSRIRKHTAPDSETEDEEVDECGDQTEGVSGVYTHTGPVSETEEEVGEYGDQIAGVNCISKHTAHDSETEEKEMNEFDDQTEGVSCIHKHTAPDSEIEEVVGEYGDQIAGVNCISKHTVPDLETEEEEVNEAVDQTEEVNCICKHNSPDSETEEDEVGVPDEQTEGVSCIHKHTFHAETEDEKVHKSGDQTEVNCKCKHTAPDSKTEEETVGEFDEQTEGMSRIHKHTAFHYEEQKVNESGDQTEGVQHICKHTAPVSEEEDEEVNESGDQTEEVNCTCKHTDFHSKTEEEEVNEYVDQTEEVNCTCKHTDSYSEEEEVNKSDEQTEGINHEHTAFCSEEEKVNETGDQTEGVHHLCKHTAPVSEEEDEELNEFVDQTEEVNCIHKYTAPESEKEEEEVGECGDRPEGESTDSLYQSLNKGSF